MAHVRLDAAAVLQQGPHAEKTRIADAVGRFGVQSRADARTEAKPSCARASPESLSHERSTRATHRAWPTRYVCGAMSLSEIGRQLHAECAVVGTANADIVLGLTDGGNGLEACLVETVLAGLARETVLILDFFHASEHLREFEKSWLSEDSARHDQLARWCHTLKHHGGKFLLTELETLDPTGRSATQLEAHRLLTNYVRNNQHRMDDPTYFANGWELGSGEIESAGKSVVNHRRLPTPLPRLLRVHRLATLLDPHRPDLAAHFPNAGTQGAEASPSASPESPVPTACAR